MSTPETEPITDRVIIARAIIGVCGMQVCAVADATDEEILSVCNALNPSGTTQGWTDVERGDVVLCERYPERIHLLVSC